MFKIFYSQADTTLFEDYEDVNTGLDEVLEIGKRYGTDGSTLFESRALLKFSMPDIVTTLNKYSADLNDCKFMLQLFATDAKSLPAEYTITANIVAQNWINGTGYLTSGPVLSNGATWSMPVSASTWISSSQHIQYKSSSFYISGSDGGGGSWLYSTSGSYFGQVSFNQSFFDIQLLTTTSSYSSVPHRETTDLNLDVTDAVKLWISGSNGYTIDNNGLIIRFSDENAADPNVNGYIRYFSRDTNTIYVPKLLMYWDNSTYTTGSLAAVDTESFIAYTSIKPTYKDTEISKIRIYARDKYPQKSPTNLFPQQVVKRLPATTYYTVLDAATDEVIIPYDDIYTKVSCDSTSNFIHLDFNGFMPERYYRLEFKIVDGFEEQYTTDQIYFKVIR